MNNGIQYSRYHHQVVLSGFGEIAQQKLTQAKVLVVGAGGLGCAALQYLVAAGVGTIGIADDDSVQLSNLHRQVLYTHDDIGALKAERAARWLQQLNREITVQVHTVRLTPRNIIGIIDRYDIILDGTDNSGSKYMINDACVITGKPVVFAAISQFEGQVSVFNHIREDAVSANYRDLFPFPVNNGNETTCNQSGVIGVLAGIIGAMQCNETIKLITAIGKPLINRLLTYNALTCQLYEFVVPARKETRLLIPKDISEFMQLDYNFPDNDRDQEQLEVNGPEFSRMIHNDKVLIIDVREPGRMLSPAEFRHIHIPYTQLNDRLGTITVDTVITFCEKGILSLRAALFLKKVFGTSKKVFSLNKGIYEWNQTCRNTQQ